MPVSERTVHFSQAEPSVVTPPGDVAYDDDDGDVRQIILPNVYRRRFSPDREIGGDVCQDSTASPLCANTRSSQLFESLDPIVLPLTDEQNYVARALNFLKRWYLFIHVFYIVSLIIIGSLLFYAIEKNLHYIDAFFIATSCVCNCGLQTIDVASWSTGSNLLRHLLMISGGIVVTSAHQPLLRLWMLRRMWPVFDRHASDTPGERALRASKRIYAEQLWFTSVICAVTPLLYFVIVNGTVMFFIAILNTSGVRGLDVFEMSIGSFHSAVFLPMEQYSGDPVIVLFVAVACGMGFTFFPVVLRGFMCAEWFVFRVFAVAYLKCRSTRTFDIRRDSVFLLISENSPLLAYAPVRHVENLFRDSDTVGSVPLNVWDRGFRDILSSKQPGAFHAFLFSRSETIYLGFAWAVITLAQAAPFWIQQWNNLLAPFSAPYKIFISLCQAVVVRFAGASFLSCLEYSNAHIAITILIMFIPALPISTDRTYRKWKQMFRTSLVRLATSRLFWLFTAMLCILFTEEQFLERATQGTRFDPMTRALFEVISAFAGCGLSLSFTASMVSFVGSLSPFSKFVVAAVMIGGRHRTVDLGIDLGFSALQVDTKHSRAEATSNPNSSMSTAQILDVESCTETIENDGILKEK